MKALTVHIIILFSILIVGCSHSEENTMIECPIVSVIAPSESTVGQPITIIAESNCPPPTLFLSHSLGATIIKPSSENSKNYHYVVPTVITQLSGLLNWKILGSKKGQSGKINIKPEKEVADIELYIGPTNLQAGRAKSAMSTALVFDQYDNLVPQHSTSFNITSTTGRITKVKHITNNGLVHQMHDAPIKTGNLSVALNTEEKTTSEFAYRINANNPTTFRISEARSHRYADGTSLCHITTGVLKDKYNNIVEDGTIVHFTIYNGKMTWQAMGMTIDGKANCQFLHPDSPSNWEVIAQTDNIVSNTLNITFEAAIHNLPSRINPENLLIIGPIESYMNQLIPDGYPLKVEIKDQDSTIITKRIYTLDGIASLDLNPLRIEKSSENLILTVSGGSLINTLNFNLDLNE